MKDPKIYAHFLEHQTRIICLSCHQISGEMGINFSAMLCESCHNLPVESIIASDEQEHPYRLCQDCAHRLLTFSLRPLNGSG